MNKKNRIFLLVLSLSVITILTSCEKQPRYEGQTVKQWMTELNSGDKALSIKAMEILSQIKPEDPEVVPAVLELIKKSTDAEVRKHAALSLGRLKDNRALDTLIELLNDPQEWRIGVEALEVYGKEAHPRLLEVLRALPTESSQLDFYILDKTIFCLRMLAEPLPEIRTGE